MVGLSVGNESQVKEDLLPEACVEQVENCVLNTADVQVGATADLALSRPHPVGQVLLRGKSSGVRRVGVTHLVPARTGPLRHGVGFTAILLRAVPQVQGDVHPFLCASQRRFRFRISIIRIEGTRRIVANLGKLNREHLFGEGMSHPIFVPNDRERLSPVTLTTEKPVTQTVGNSSASQALFFEPLGHCRLCRVLIQTIEANLFVRGVNCNAITGVGALAQVVSGRVLSITDSANDIQIKTLSEFPVTIIVCRNCHDRAGAVIHEDIISNEHRNATAIDRVNCPQAREDTRLLPRVFCALLRSLCPSLCTVGRHGLGRRCIATTPGLAGAFGPARGDIQRCLVRGRTRGGATKEWVLGRPDDEGCAKESVGTSRVDREATITDAFTDCNEVNFRAVGAANPVALHGAHLFRPVNGVEVFSEAITVGGNTHHPLTQAALENRVVTTLGTAIRRHFFVGQNGSQTRAPVHGRLGDIGEAVGIDDLRALTRIQFIPRTSLRDLGGKLTRSGSKLCDQFADRTRGTQASSITTRCLRIKP